MPPYPTKPQNMEKESSIKKIRESFSKEIRKSQIQKIHKSKREKQMKFVCPLWYLEKLKKDLIQKQFALSDLSEAIQFLTENIKDDRFADVLQEEQIIEILIINMIEKFEPWSINELTKTHHSSISSEFSSYYQECQCQNKLECIDCSESSTLVSQTAECNFAQEIQIDKDYEYRESGIIQTFKNTSINEKNDWTLVFNNFLDFLQITFYHYLNQEEKENFGRLFCFESSKLTKFNLLFINTPELLESFLLDMIHYQKGKSIDKNMQAIFMLIQQQPQRIQLITKIMEFLSKIGKVSYLQNDSWIIVFQLYSRYLFLHAAQGNLERQSTKKIKEMLAVACKSFAYIQILSDSRNINHLNQLLFPWIRSIKQILVHLSDSNNFRRKQLEQIFRHEFQLAIKLLKHIKFIEKRVNDEIKQILGELLNITKLLENEEFGSGGIFKYMYISCKTIQKEESGVLKACKLYSEKLVEILYFQMELSDNDLYKISEVQPYMKQKIEQIIDADTY